MKLRNALLLGAVGIAVAGFAAWKLQPQPVPVETAQVRRGAWEQAIVEDGKTRVRDRYVISAPLAGRVERIALEPGDPIEKGRVVALLKPAAPAFLDARTTRELTERIGAAEANLARASAEVRKVKAQRDQVESDLARQTRLARDGFVSQTALEQARLALDTAERALDASRYAEDAAGHEHAQARAALARYRMPAGGGAWEVTSPITGSVLKVLQKSEATVALGTPLLEIANPRSLEAIVDVLSQDAVGIAPGMPARLEVGPSARAVAARVRSVEPAAFTKVSALGIEEQRVNVVLDFVEPLDHIRTLGDGYRLDAHIITRRLDDVVTVPLAGLFRDTGEHEGEWGVFVVKDGRAQKRPVKIDARNADSAVVAAGLSADERVVVYPPDSLKDGARIVAAAQGR